MLSIQQVTKKIEDKSLLDNVSFDVPKGSSIGLIGPNGAGKSTLMKLISAYEKPTGGSITFHGQDVQHWNVKKLAQRIAVLTQEGLAAYPIKVFDAILLGRYPHLGFFQRESKKDYELVEEVLAFTSLTDLKDQFLDTLSGGERQRVAIAKAMVQQPELLLLDEPTTFLDIGHQLNILRLVKEWQRKDTLTVIMVMHDLNLASQFCEELILMSEGKVVRSGSNEEIIDSDLLKNVYHTTPEIIRHPKSNVPQILLGHF